MESNPSNSDLHDRNASQSLLLKKCPHVLTKNRMVRTPKLNLLDNSKERLISKWRIAFTLLLVEKWNCSSMRLSVGVNITWARQVLSEINRHTLEVSVTGKKNIRVRNHPTSRIDRNITTLRFTGCYLEDNEVNKIKLSHKVELFLLFKLIYKASVTMWY